MMEMIKLCFGPPRLLSTENAEAYDAMLRHYVDSCEPRDLLEQGLVKRLVDANWESLRIKRHKARAIERRNRCPRRTARKFIRSLLTFSTSIFRRIFKSCLRAGHLIMAVLHLRHQERSGS
jgi:hypothetical protein